jgi:hypothetical protein
MQEGYLMQEDQLMGEEDPSNQRDEMVRSYLLKQEADELMQTDKPTDDDYQLTRKDLLTHGDQLTLEQLARAFSHHAAAAERSTLSTGTVPEIIDQVFAKTSCKRSFSMTETEHFGLVFVNTGSINSGTGRFRTKMFVFA